MNVNRLFRSSEAVYGAIIVLFLLLPAFAVVPMAFSSGQFLQFPPPGYSTHWMQEFFADPGWRAALLRSLLVAIGSACISVPLGVLASIYFIRSRSSGLSRMVEPFMMLPMMVPVVIFGFALYIMTLRLDVERSLVLVTFAHAMLGLPFVIVTVGASLRTFDFRLIAAANICGATKLHAYIKVVFPIIAPSILAAALIVLMVSLDEPVISTFIAGNTPTISAKMFSSIVYDLNPLVPVAATVLMTVTMGLLLAAGGVFFIYRKKST